MYVYMYIPSFVVFCGVSCALRVSPDSQDKGSVYCAVELGTCAVVDV